MTKNPMQTKRKQENEKLRKISKTILEILSNKT